MRSISSNGTLEFTDVWLEIQNCADGEIGQDGIVTDSYLEDIAALSEIFREAEKANASLRGHSGMWDYSRRLDRAAISEVMKRFTFSKKTEDTRSVSFVTQVMYRSSCYTLTVFVIKSQ